MDLQLKELQQTDLKWIKCIYQDESIMKHIGRVLTADQVVQAFQSMMDEMTKEKAHYQIIVDKDHALNVGLCSMHWYAKEQKVISGMIVLPEHQNMGVCKWAQMAAMNAVVLRFPFTVCSVYISPDNVAANTSYRNIGFVRVANNSIEKHQKSLNRWDYYREQLRP